MGHVLKYPLPAWDPLAGNARMCAVAQVAPGAFGVYVHVPYCASRCGYCDFNTYTAAELGPGLSRATYADDVIREIIEKTPTMAQAAA